MGLSSNKLRNIYHLCLRADNDRKYLWNKIRNYLCFFEGDEFRLFSYKLQNLKAQVILIGYKKCDFLRYQGFPDAINRFKY